jgi:hypothetical protein
VTISLHTIEALVGDTVIPVKDASITIDEGWSPYVQGRFTAPLQASLLASLDPRNKARVKFYVNQKYGLSEKLSVLSATFGGGTIATVTAAWTGDTLADISAAYFTPYNVSGVNYNYRRGFDLTLRSRTINIRANEMSFEVSSDEALLQDYALVSELPYTPTFFNVRSIVQYVLLQIGAVLQPGIIDGTVEPDAAIWEPGQTAWDYVTPLLSATGLRLYNDEKRRWYLIDDTYTVPGTVELEATGTITEATDTISRDDNEWYDAVVITYTFVNDLGETIKAYDTASVEGYSKVLHLEYESAFPGAGAAQRILDRAITRGRVNGVEAVSDYRVTPAQAYTLELTGFPIQDGYISAVQWDYPANEMTITTRESGA